ncbi:RagB/SusD family nutrient uptake outer membrane protein [Fodinibius salsisoli]|uniref:RagB/SusD family nutrient uptake outer membrane protein n=1 Tax=Fodinibius salsisoli TaxID=2820877 RepID=A0ABT3PQ46_9BACT|nr:RagB/SusD family nutrient uptake outer membrane protein [Fodinibius salsisoli]MCW9707979.1 RagB/SusD family nutrient uptake outer membrane protein [Fodinibius salsisoli]
MLRIVAVLLAITATSCDVSSPLDRNIVGDLDKERVFTDMNLTYEFVNNIYSVRTDGYTQPVGAAMLASATDDAYYSNQSGVVHFMNNDSWSSTFNPADIWDEMYEGIRKTNLFFENSDQMVLEEGGYPVRHGEETGQDGGLITAEQLRSRLTGEVHFLRAFFYFQLLKRYGGVPLYTQTFDLGESIDATRASAEETVSFIIDDLDQAINTLPMNYDHYTANRGRATTPMAMALKAQVLLWAASPLHNPSGDTQKWVDAAEAAKAVMDLGVYELDSDYKSVFVRNLDSPEIIFSLRSGPTNVIEQAHTPVGYESGGGGINPTQDLVDAYEMANGESFDWDNPTHAADPYANRDPRFYTSILHNGAQWRDRAVETYVGGQDGEGVQNATLTGYYMGKFLDPDLDLLRNQTSVKNWVILRYAEILLGYAEAQNEAVGPDQSVYDAVNAVRSRVGMPDLPTGLSQEQMRQRIRHERRIEFAFEGQRFFDVRRWDIGTDTFDGPIRGVRITEEGEGNYNYNIIELQNRVYTEKMNLFPIPQSEINNTDGVLTQNPGW